MTARTFFKKERFEVRLKELKVTTLEIKGKKGGLD